MNYIIKYCPRCRENTKYYLLKSYKFEDKFECQFCKNVFIEDKAIIDRDFDIYSETNNRVKRDPYYGIIFPDE